MLMIPQWFSKPDWVLHFEELRVAIQEATERRNRALARRAKLRSLWRRAKAGR